MHTYDVYSWLAKASWLFFIVAFGCCVGSLINVLAYRLPRGISVVLPPSRCPACETRLTWRENIPVLGWLLLRGRCRFCKSRISPEYPLVEAFVGLLFGVFFALWYLVPPGTRWLGVEWGAVRPDWAWNPPDQTWPAFVILLMLLGSLVAMTIVDAKTYTIPLVLPWFAAAVGLIVHPLHAAWIQLSVGELRWTAPGWAWTIPTPGWWWIGASIGAAIGLGVSMLLLRFGLIRRSFADYEEWEARLLAEHKGDDPPPPAPAPVTPDLVPPPSHTAPPPVTAATSSAAPDKAVEAPTAGDPDVWIQYPHARREMFKELVFLSPAVSLGVLGGVLARELAGPWSYNAASERMVAAAGEPPLWLAALGGALMGYLIGGGVVWLVRILGSLGFGKEAMGLGDVHLMAAVGACLGWIDATLAFFGAAFVGIFWALLGQLARGAMSRALPYGPFLAAATVLVLLLKPLIERGLNLLFQIPPGATPINIP